MAKVYPPILQTTIIILKVICILTASGQIKEKKVIERFIKKTEDQYISRKVNRSKKIQSIITIKIHVTFPTTWTFSKNFVTISITG